MQNLLSRRRRPFARLPRKYVYLAGALVFAALAVLCVVGFVRADRYEDRLSDLTNYTARNIRSDINQAVQACDTLNRRGDSADSITSMKRAMYAAYRQNLCLVVALGEGYSMLDTASYNSFQTMLGEYERLSANGQSTQAALSALTEYMSSLAASVAGRFDSHDLLLPGETARKIAR